MDDDDGDDIDSDDYDDGDDDGDGDDDDVSGIAVWPTMPDCRLSPTYADTTQAAAAELI